MATEKLELPRPQGIEDLENLKAQAYREGVLDLVRQGKISPDEAAELLNIGQSDFLDLLEQHGISVLPSQTPNQPQAETDQSARPIWEIAEEISASVPDEEWAKVPSDLAKNLDHYLYYTENVKTKDGV